LSFTFHSVGIGWRLENTLGTGKVGIAPHVDYDRRRFGAEPCIKGIWEIECLRSSMRNLLDESSDAQSLDEDRLTGSLHFPVAFFS